MKVGKNVGRIMDYGITKTKLGTSQVFIRIRFEDGTESNWFGTAIKKDGEANTVMLQQLAYCGFDPSSNSIEDLSNGLESGLLITDEDLDIYCSNQVNQIGQEELKISSLGAIGPARLSAEEAKSLFTQEQLDAIKALGSKIKPRQRKAKQNPEEPTPF